MLPVPPSSLHRVAPVAQASDGEHSDVPSAVAGGQKAIVLLLALPVVFAMSGLLGLRIARFQGSTRSDFVQEWTSARNYWTGRPIYLSLQESLPLYLGPEATSSLTVNAHPPTAVLVAIPSGMLDYGTAWKCWNLLSLAALAASLWLLFRPEGLGGSGWLALPIAALVLLSYPLREQVQEGQFNLLLLLLLTGAWAANRRGRPKLSGALIGAAAAIKLFPGFLLVYFLARRQWGALAAAAVTGAGVILLTGAVLGIDCFRIYFVDVLPQFASYRNNLGNVSLTGIWSKVFVGTPGHVPPLWQAAEWLPVATLLSAVAVAALCGWKAYSAQSVAQRDVAFGLCVIGMLLASPITWGHSLLMLTLPLAILWRHSRPGHPVRKLLGVAVFVLALLPPRGIWILLVPGFEAKSLGIAPAGMEISSFHSLTVLAYLSWILLGIFTIALFVRAPAEDTKLPACG